MKVPPIRFNGFVAAYGKVSALPEMTDGPVSGIPNAVKGPPLD